MLIQDQVHVFQWLYIKIWWALVGTLSDFGTLFRHNTTKRLPTCFNEYCYVMINTYVLCAGGCGFVSWTTDHCLDYFSWFSHSSLLLSYWLSSLYIIHVHLFNLFHIWTCFYKCGCVKQDFILFSSPATCMAAGKGKEQMIEQKQ
jgi:hypothetical protein